MLGRLLQLENMIFKNPKTPLNGDFRRFRQAAYKLKHKSKKLQVKRGRSESKREEDDPREEIGDPQEEIY